LHTGLALPSVSFTVKNFSGRKHHPSNQHAMFLLETDLGLQWNVSVEYRSALCCGVLPQVMLLCQFYFAALYLMFAFQKDNTRWKAEERPEFEDRSETTRKRASEDGNDGSVSKCLKSTDLTVGAGGETL
jgi:hypothetical protein